MRLILASSSPYRAKLLSRLHLPFDIEAPGFEELMPGEMPVGQLIRWNTLGKAHSVLKHHPESTIIASDQLAVCGQDVLGKPGSEVRACRQLQRLSGRCVTFLTGLAILAEGEEHYEEIPFRVYFRNLRKSEIRTYVQRENPVDCAGSFKVEGLGICLFDRLEGDDPTALMGLPLIRLSHYLQPLHHRHV